MSNLAHLFAKEIDLNTENRQFTLQLGKKCRQWNRLTGTIILLV